METISASESKKRIIIADASEKNCEKLASVLGNEYKYVYVNDGDTLLNMLSDGELADLILLNSDLANINGMGVLKVMCSRHWTDEIPVIMMSDEADSAFIQKVYELGAAEYILCPYRSVFVRHRVSATLMQTAQRKRLAKYAEQQIHEREKMNKMLVNIFGGLVELRNDESGEHTMHVQEITKMLLKRLVRLTDRYSFSEEEMDMISTVSALHDIGKVFVPEEILNKPGKLTPEEWEIMKQHTVRGDEFLHKITVNYSGRFMATAREICRSHHERYDGRGYPDGLAGDEIPIAAQVVSVADVYDALTSDRCYKKAYLHEEAIAMICNGSCGSFNPLLIRCLQDISDDLLLRFRINLTQKIDVIAPESVEEAVQPSDMRVDERVERLLEYEVEKKEFFAEKCHGIQFEYDAERRKVVYLTHYDQNGKRISLSSEDTQLLNEQDMEKLTERVGKMTRQNSTASFNVLISVGEDMRWFNLTVKSIWGKDGGRYKSLVGQFTDIHDTVLKKGAEVLINGKSIDSEGILALRDVFDLVRLVDVDEHEVLKIDEQGQLVRTGQKCYQYWGRKRPCRNCSSCKTAETKNWVNKLESYGECGYSVMSKCVKCGERDCVLEVVCCLDDHMKLDKKIMGYTSIDMSAMRNYYRDTVTHTYSRAYLDTILPGVDNISAVAVIDVDHFKSINDRYGHIIGDRVLKHVAKQIRNCVKKSDTVIRYGGDEFVVAFFDITEKEFWEELAYIKQTVHESVLEELPGFSVGISIGGAYGVTPISAALEVADKEMYRDKFGESEEAESSDV